jgi:hypothetical protein
MSCISMRGGDDVEKTQKLEMVFKDSEGSNSKISVDDPKPDLTEETVKNAMTEIIASDVFETNNGDLKLVVGASIVTTTEDEVF